LTVERALGGSEAAVAEKKEAEGESGHESGAQGCGEIGQQEHDASSVGVVGWKIREVPRAQSEEGGVGGTTFGRR
jgi:hypothetical protein